MNEKFEILKKFKISKLKFSKVKILNSFQVKKWKGKFPNSYASKEQEKERDGRKCSGARRRKWREKALLSVHWPAALPTIFRFTNFFCLFC
jgi:hypothetical protein